MKTIVISYLLSAIFIGVCLTQSTIPPPRIQPGCTLNGSEIQLTGDPFVLNQTIYDTIKKSVIVPEGGSFVVGENVSSIWVHSTRYVSVDYYGGSVFRLEVQPIDETIELSRSSEYFYYNFTILLDCKDGGSFQVGSVIPLHETNTYTPTFSQKVYQYSLFSTYHEDLERLMELNPIIANDNDISNTEVIFGISPNEYFEVQYGGLIPGSLNKNHSLKLIPKKSTINLLEELNLQIYVTDIGYPPRSSNATLILKPSNIYVPTFEQPYYIGDYSINGSFKMRSAPELKAVPDYYQIDAAITGPIYSECFTVEVQENILKIASNTTLPEIAIYKYNYLLFGLIVTYIDTSNNFVTKGAATVIVELQSSNSSC